MFIMIIFPCYSDKMSFWIDNIHCYAYNNQRTGLELQDTQDGGLNPPIIVVCTGDEPGKNPVSLNCLMILTPGKRPI